MKKFIYNLRSQPEEVRRHVLHISTIVIGIILVFVWMFSLGTSLTDSDTKAKVSNDLKPFSALKANIVDGYKSISGSSELNID
jgi:hypothetical protein